MISLECCSYSAEMLRIRMCTLYSLILTWRKMLKYHVTEITYFEQEMQITYILLIFKGRNIRL